MRGAAAGIFKAICVMFIFACFNGCSHVPIKDGGLEIGKDITAGIDDVGVGRLTKQF